MSKCVAEKLEKNVCEDWLWKGRHVFTVDGSTLSMPDTALNQKAFPQHTNQKKGIGFPLARFVCLNSLATGAVMDFSMGSFIGKGKGELHHANSLLDSLKKSDILLGDRFYVSYFFISLVLSKGADFVTKSHEARKFKSSKKMRLARGDNIVILEKPRIPHTGWLSEEEYNAAPEKLILRITEVNIKRHGFRSQKLTVVSTLIDSKKYSKEDLAELYFKRWTIEVDLRSIKRVINLNVLTCKTPDMILKEAWLRLLAYNLVRRIMAQAATQTKVLPRQISFTGCLRTIEIYRPILKYCAKKIRDQIYSNMLDVIGAQIVGDRPLRLEPRCIKRRPHRNYRVLNIKRSKWKKKFGGAMAA